MKILPMLALGLGLVVASPAFADWRIYGAADVGFSVLDASADGQVLGTATVYPLDGSDDDVSPLVAGILGIALPINEILPRRMTGGLTLPNWPLRFEVEAVGLREYDLRTSSIVPATSTQPSSGPIHTEIESWAVMGNIWLDVPLRGLYPPISWTSSRLFGRRRLQPLKDVLDRMTLDIGAGIGVANLDAKVREADGRGSDEANNFAWQSGVGLGYRMTDRVKLTIGYRYFDPGDVDIPLAGSAILLGSELELDNEVHEARAGIRVLLYEFPNPWR